jgi:hypothetical protein
MAGYLDQAQDWLADWKNRKNEQKGKEENPFDVPPTEEDFPF